MESNAMFEGANFPHESLTYSHQEGCTEPWIAEIVSSLLKAKGGNPVVLETGGFLGTTSSWLALALAKMGGGRLTVCEIDQTRAQSIRNRMESLPLTGVQWHVTHVDALQFIDQAPPRTFDLVWVDDDHQAHHVEQEINALWPKMKNGGLILFHDVSSDGVCNLGPLIRKYGGIALDLPRLGPDGGLGIIQIPS